MGSVGFVIARASANSPRYILKTEFRCPVLFCETIISPRTLTLPTSWHYRSVRQRWRNPIRAQPQQGSGVHGSLFWNHNNSIFSARSFFQVGPVKPARQNQYGATVGTQLWEGGFFTFNGSEDKNRGYVNGNVLIPLPEERTPLATDPATRAMVQTLLGAYPNVFPNRTDQAARALNTNSLQSVNTNLANGQLSQKLGTRDAIMFRYNFTGQQVTAFQFVTGQNPNTDNKSHGARIT